MYQILLAEDEPEVLDAVLETIDWEAYSFRRPVGCRDGREAISVLEDGFTPDLIITDICMPFVDGLDLTRYAAVNRPEAIVVVISGYDEFSYAQQALQLKVYDYLLKPIAPSHINGLLERVGKELKTRRMSTAKDAVLILAGHFLNRLLGERLEPETIQENCRHHGLRLEGDFHLAMVADFDHSGEDVANDLELLRYGLHNIAQELFDSRKEAVVFQGQDGAVKIIVSGETASACRCAAKELAQQLIDTVCSLPYRSVSVGIGDVTGRLEELHHSHSQAVKALTYRFFYGKSTVLCLWDIQRREALPLDFSPVYEEFEQALKELNSAAARRSIAQLFGQLKENHISFGRCTGCCQRIVAALLALSSQFGGQQEADEIQKAWAETNLYATSTIDQLEVVMQDLCSQVLDLFQSPRNDSSSGLAMRAEAYLRKHYSDPEISLQAVTEHLAISVSYFSVIFKSHTGSTFVEYLTRLRMEKARQILAATDKRTYEIAEDVGFVDPHYFSVAFKRVTGMSPREYRKYCQKASSCEACAVKE